MRTFINLNANPPLVHKNNTTFRWYCYCTPALVCLVTCPDCTLFILRDLTKHSSIWTWMLTKRTCIYQIGDNLNVYISIDIPTHPPTYSLHPTPPYPKKIAWSFMAFVLLLEEAWSSVLWRNVFSGNVFFGNSFSAKQQQQCVCTCACVYRSIYVYVSIIPFALLRRSLCCVMVMWMFLKFTVAYTLFCVFVIGDW